MGRIKKNKRQKGGGGGERGGIGKEGAAVVNNWSSIGDPLDI